jgi:predicted RNA binding protein YcfA (HicA-like mRNA interferase family)
VPPVPGLSGREIRRTFEGLGWSVARQRGSHIIMVKDGEIASLSIPDHRDVAKGTLRSLIRAANLTVPEFLAALRRR